MVYDYVGKTTRRSIVPSPANAIDAHREPLLKRIRYGTEAV